ncbi:retropepsin-like domain-containing protein [bacterium]|nr:retropepsin-like domain-containing protein [bacterium]
MRWSAGLCLFLVSCPVLAKPLQCSFEIVGGHLLKVPVRLNDTTPSFMILDTGIGLNLLSPALAQRLRCPMQGSYTGQRMSGQPLEVPLAGLESLALAGRRQAPVQVGLWDMAGLLPGGEEFQGVAGFLSLTYFRDLPFTLDYSKKLLILEDEASLAVRADQGQAVPIRCEWDKETALTASVALSLPEGTAIQVQLDSGSDSLILDESWLARLGIGHEDAGVTRRQGKDETGHEFTRYFAHLAAPVRLLEAPEIASQPSPSVMFQPIIHQGLLGHSFLRDYTVTWDLPHSRLLFAKP